MARSALVVRNANLHPERMGFEPVPSPARALSRDSEQRWAAWLPWIAGTLVLLAAAMSRLGAAIGSEALLQEGTDHSALTAVPAFVSLALALVLLMESNGGQRMRWTLRSIAAVTGVVCAIVAAGGIIDPIVVVRMSPAAGVLLLTLAVAWMIGMTRRVPQALAGVVAIIAGVVLVSYAFDIESWRRFPRFGSVSMQTAAAVLVLAVGGLFAAPESWLRRIVAGREDAHLVMRRLTIPAIVTLPMLVFIARVAVDAGSFSSTLERSFVPVTAWMLSCLFGLWGAAGSFRLHKLRHDAAVRFELDPVTGAGNRFALERVFSRAFHDPNGPPQAALLAIEVDGFASIGRRIGRERADRILGELAATMRYRIRPSDTFVRTGETRFAIYAVDVDPSGAAVVARNVASAVDEWRAKHEGYPGVSIGIASVDPSVMDADDLMRHADTALQTAKQRGGSSTVSYRPLSTGTPSVLEEDALLSGTFAATLEPEPAPAPKVDAGRPSASVGAFWEGEVRGADEPTADEAPRVRRARAVGRAVGRARSGSG